MKLLRIFIFCFICIVFSSFSLRANWQSAPPLNTPRFGATAVVLNGYIYVFGGKTNNNMILNTVERYDPHSRVWNDTIVAPFEKARYNAAAVVFNNKIYLIGGRNNKKILKDVEVYDPVQNSWEYAQKLRKKREGFIAVAVDSGIYVIGGQEDELNPVDDIDFYDPIKNEWNDTEKHMLSPRVAPFALAVSDTFYLFGGIFYGPTATTFKAPFDFDWIEGPNLQTGRAYGATAQLGDSIFIIGGETNSGTCGCVEIYNLQTGQIEPGTEMPTPRSGVSAVTSNDTIYVMGGISPDHFQIFSTVEIFTNITTAIDDKKDSLPEDFVTFVGYPNPFNGRINLKIELPRSGWNEITLYDVQGRKINTIYQGHLTRGTHFFNWDGKNQSNISVASGIYIAILKGERYFQKLKIIYVK